MTTSQKQIPDFMYYADTIHDMYPVSNSSRGENIRPYLDKIMPPNVQAWLDSQININIKTNSKVTASNIELSTEKYIEDSYPLPSIKNDGIKLTYSDIMNDYKDRKLLSMVEMLRGDKDVLVISGIEDKVDISKDSPERNYIANFILNFFISDYKNQNVGFSFDAAKGKLPYIFHNISQCRTCNTALTYADSANTSEPKSLSKLNQTDVIFPQDKNGDYVYPVTSNFFTKDIFNISYTSDTVYNYKNPSAVALNVHDKQSGNVYKSYFNTKHANGTSVGDIKKIILDDQTNKPKFDKMLKINEITDYINNKELFLYDYKRSGDYEQVNAMEYVSKNYQFSIFSSIDILCVLYARVKGINCIRTQGGNLYLYRFTTTEQTLSDEVKLNKKIANIKLKCRRLIKLIELSGSLPGLNTENLNTQISNIDNTIAFANSQTLPLEPLPNILLIINLELVKNKLNNILGSGSLISGISIKVESILNNYEKDKGKINRLLGTRSIYIVLIQFLNNFIDADITELGKLITKDGVFYSIDGNNESISINIEDFIKQFGDDQSDVYEEIITTLDKLYKKSNSFDIKVAGLITTKGDLDLGSKKIDFPEFTTENFVILNKTIQIIDKMKKIRETPDSKPIRNYPKVYIAERDEAIKYLDVIIKNIESLDSTIGLELKSIININALYEITGPALFIKKIGEIEKEINRIYVSGIIPPQNSLTDGSPDGSLDGSPDGSLYGSPGSPSDKLVHSENPFKPLIDDDDSPEGSPDGSRDGSRKMDGGARIKNPEFYFELNELFTSITTPLRNIIDSAYSIAYPIQNILTHMLDLKKQINDIINDTQEGYTDYQKEINIAYTWNRNITTINNLIHQHISDIPRFKILNEISEINDNISQLNSIIDALKTQINNSNYLEFIQEINNNIYYSNIKEEIIDEIHYLYAKWILEFDILLYKNNIDIADIHLPKSLDLIGFMLSMTSITTSKTINNPTSKTITNPTNKRKRESDLVDVLDVLDERYESKLYILQQYQNNGSKILRDSGINTADLVEYNNIYTYYALKLSYKSISPEIITASIFAYLDYKIRDDILLFDFPNEVTGLIPKSKLLTENEWDLFYTNIAHFFASLESNNKSRKGGKTRKNKRNKKHRKRFSRKK